MPAIAGVIVLVALVVIVSGRVPAVLALICALLVAGFIGIATPAELFAGLSNGGVITIAAMLVIAKGVFGTGVVTRVTYRLLFRVTSVRQALVRLIPPVGLLSALINTTPRPAEAATAIATGVRMAAAVLLTLIGTCISLTFLNPISHQTNMMVMGPGGYSTKTFVRYGIPVTAVCLAVAIATGWILLTR